MANPLPEHPPVFPPVSFTEWLKRVEDEFGVDGVESLHSRTEDGLTIAPLYAAESSAPVLPYLPGQYPFVRAGEVRKEPGWDIRVLRDEPDTAACAAAARDDLKGGATSILICCVPQGAPPGRGVRVESLDELDAALDGAHLDMIGVSLDAGVHFMPAASALIALWERRGVPHDARRGELGGDPLAALARLGSLASSPEYSLAQLADLASWTHTNLRAVRAVRVSTVPYSDAGCTPGQELGVALATGVCYLRAMDEAGIPVGDAAAQIVFDVCLGTEQFQEIARLRALRLAWSRILGECGVHDEAPVINARLARRTLTRRDPAVNMLRGTVACLAAAAGGANSVIVPPFDAAVGVPNALARRIARNTQHVLDEESGLGHVVDPAAGSWFVESLTSQFADLAWREFRLIEAGGGMVDELLSGRLSGRIAESREERERRVAARELSVTGVSAFANVEESPLQRTSYTEPLAVVRPSRAASADALDAAGRSRDSDRPGSMTEAAVDAVREGAVFGDVSVLISKGPLPAISQLPSHSIAEPFEALRDRSDAFLKRTGSRPKAFIATLGTASQYSARASFTVSALAAGGIDSEMPGPLAGAEEAARSFLSSGCTFAAVTTSDEVANDLAESTVRMLYSAGASLVLYAGRAGNREAWLTEAGVRGFLYKGCSLPDLFDAVYSELESNS